MWSFGIGRGAGLLICVGSECWRSRIGNCSDGVSSEIGEEPSLVGGGVLRVVVREFCEG